MSIYTFIADPAHGWLAVPLAEIRELGIAGDISQYSYIDTSEGVAYLEEDGDTLRFIEAKGINIRDREALGAWCAENTRECYHDNLSENPVRNCERFSKERAAA